MSLDATACKQIVICGHRGETGEILAGLLAASASSPVDLRLGMSALSVLLGGSEPVVTVSPDDVWGLKRIMAPSVCAIVVMRDPRDLLLLRQGDSNGEFQLGYDHALHVSPKGIVTLSDPGVLSTQVAVESLSKRFPQVMVLRHEELQSSPDLVQVRLEKLTGLNLSKSFSELLSENIKWQDSVRTSFRYKAAKGILTSEESERLLRQFTLAPGLFEILDRWGLEAPGDRRWFHDLAREAPHALDNRPGVIVGYYTQGTLYEVEATRMVASIRRLDLPVHLEAIDGVEDWLVAVRFKPNFLLGLRRRLRGPLLYVDVDAVVHRDPWPYLRGYRGDVAVSGHRGEAIISGTLLLNDTEGAVHFIESWIAEQERQPDAWDQHTLEATVLANQRSSDPKVRIQYLPPEMCRVFNRAYSLPVEPVIEHLQASRERFAASADVSLQRNLASRRDRVAELDALLSNAPAAAALAPTPRLAFADQPAEVRRKLSQDLIAARQSDYLRWSDTANFKSDWSARARLVAALVLPGERVLDLGCGMMDLERHLPPGCIYLPADVIRRDSRTTIVDLNAGCIPDLQADVVTMLGVLEYMHDPAGVLARLARRWARLVATYHPVDLNRRQDRRSHGWFNDLSSGQLVAMAVAAGYQLDAIVPHGDSERLYAFSIGKSAT